MHYLQISYHFREQLHFITTIQEFPALIWLLLLFILTSLLLSPTFNSKNLVFSVCKFLYSSKQFWQGLYLIKFWYSWIFQSRALHGQWWDALYHDLIITKFLILILLTFIQTSGSREYCSVPQGIKIICFNFWLELEFLESFGLIKNWESYLVCWFVWIQ